MSSIKRDVKKKLLPWPESECVARDPAHGAACFPGEVWLVLHARGLLLCRHPAVGFVRAASATG
jgi:hypothetical protein